MHQEIENCRKAISEKIGKVIIVDIIVEEDNNDLFDETRTVFDLVKMAHTSKGKERTEARMEEIIVGRRFPSLQNHQNSNYTIHYRGLSNVR